MLKPFQTEVKSVEELRALYREPSQRALDKVLPELDKHAQRFIELSPYFTISSQSPEGFIDTAPRGGEPGFVKVLSPTEIVFGDSRGNNRLDTYLNILECSKVGLMFLLPGVDETLRVKGTARLYADEASLALASDKGKSPTVAVKIDISEQFIHCGKSAIRSGLWTGEYKIERSTFPSIAQIMKDQQQLKDEPVSQQEIDKHYRETLEW